MPYLNSTVAISKMQSTVKAFGYKATPMQLPSQPNPETFGRT